MKPGTRKPPRKQPGPQDPIALLRDYAIKLHDKGDGHGVEWARVASALFRAAFGCIDEAGASPDARKVLRRVEAGLYDRLAGNPDDGTAYLPPAVERPPYVPDQAMKPGLDHTRR